MMAYFIYVTSRTVWLTRQMRRPKDGVYSAVVVANSADLSAVASAASSFLAKLALFGKAGGLAHAVAQVEKLGTTRFAAAPHHNLGNVWRVQGENTLDAFIIDDAANGEGFVDAGTLLLSPCR